MMSARRTPKLRPASDIPQVASIEEEARSWDSHDTMDFATAFGPVEASFAAELSASITLHVDPPTRRALEQVAREHEQNVPALAHAWVLDRLKREMRSAEEAR